MAYKTAAIALTVAVMTQLSGCAVVDPNYARKQQTALEKASCYELQQALRAAGTRKDVRLIRMAQANRGCPYEVASINNLADDADYQARRPQEPRVGRGAERARRYLDTVERASEVPHR